MDNQQAADFPPQRSPGPARNASTAVEEPPASPVRSSLLLPRHNGGLQEEHKRQNGRQNKQFRLFGTVAHILVRNPSPSRPQARATSGISRQGLGGLRHVAHATARLHKLDSKVGSLEGAGARCLEGARRAMIADIHNIHVQVSYVAF